MKGDTKMTYKEALEMNESKAGIDYKIVDGYIPFSETAF
jgi:hypothetical protein